jgi:hypothetical protein
MPTASSEQASKPSEGPDIAFVQLPPSVQNYLAAEQVFQSFELRFKKPSQVAIHAFLLCGVIAEKSRLKKINSQARTDEHTMVEGGGIVIRERDAPNGYDLFDFKLSQNQDIQRPHSYGGLSGSAVWRVPLKAGQGQPTIYGVVFHEIDQDKDGNRIITCHGPQTVYVKLLEIVKKEFPNQYKDII